MCLENMIGIRGECTTTTPKIYIDDLPGINIQNVSDVIEGMHVRPAELVRNAFNLAVDQVYNDWINQINSAFDYHGVISDIAYLHAGTHQYYGENGRKLGIKIHRAQKYRRFVQSKIYQLAFVSDRNIVKEITIKDKYTTTTKEYEITEGYNAIDMEILTDSQDVMIYMDMSDWKIGRSENSVCHPCIQHGCSDCVYLAVVDSSDDFATETTVAVGFDLTVQCVADKCAIVEYFIQLLKVPLLYKTGINYLIHAKMTSRVNAYTRNSQEKIDELLLMWQGGTDAVTGIRTNSAYWQSLKAAAESTISTLKHMSIPVFHYNGSAIVNMLP